MFLLTRGKRLPYNYFEKQRVNGARVEQLEHSGEAGLGSAAGLGKPVRKHRAVAEYFLKAFLDGPGPTGSGPPAPEFLKEMTDRRFVLQSTLDEVKEKHVET